MVSDFNAQKARENLRDGEWTFDLLLEKALMAAKIASEAKEMKVGFGVYKNDVYPSLLDDVLTELKARGFGAEVKSSDNGDVIYLNISW